MAKATVITYQCEECGSEFVVTPTGEMELSPIYCCGFEVTEVAPPAKKASAPRKKAVKKAAAKKTAAKKKPAAKKKTSAKKKSTKK